MNDIGGSRPLGGGVLAATPDIDMAKLRTYRLERVRQELRRHDYAGILLYDPLNIRYATDSRNMSVWTMHNAVRYAFIATEGPVVLFDFHRCDHLSEHLGTVDEVRTAVAWFYFGVGAKVAERAEHWAREIADLVTAHGGGNRRLAVDNCNLEGVAVLQRLGVELRSGQEIMEHARFVKSPEEIACMRASVAVSQAAMTQMREALEPGVTENEIWAILNQVNAANDGEWIETRLLSAGQRSNPWFRESSNKVVEAGELLSFDTDMIGPYGYCADVSRTYFCGDRRPSAEQCRLYKLAREQIEYNMALLKPGLGFRELVEKSWKMPDDCLPNRYSVVVHGVGLCDEYPACYYLEDFDTEGYDGVFEANTTICVESYMGAVGGADGVKLEQQVLITEQGVELLSTYPFEDDRFGREI